MNNAKKIKCPICGDDDLIYLPWLGQIYECRKCGYRGPVVLEDRDLKISFH